MIETAIFQLYYKTIFRQSEDGFVVKPKDYSFNHFLFFNSSIEFTRCISSEYVLFCILKLNKLSNAQRCFAATVSKTSVA